MIISDEQYDEMEKRINELSLIIGFMLHGSMLTIPVENMRIFMEAYATNHGIVVEYRDDKIYIQMMRCDEEK